jgi:hypothetical protein
MLRTQIVCSFTFVGLLMAAVPASRAQDNAPYCRRSELGVECIYRSMAQCHEAKQPNAQCFTREQIAGTTGMGNPDIPPIEPGRRAPLSDPNSLPERN